MRTAPIRFCRIVLPIFTAIIALAATGCGIPGEPSPPSLQLPARVNNLTAVRTASTVKLAWTMPVRTTDHISLKNPIQVEICRALQDGPCQQLAQITVNPGKQGSYEDALSGTLAHGSARLLIYRLHLQNHAGRSAGPSNSAYSAAGDAPPAVTGLTAEVRQGSVLLIWNSVSEQRFVPGQPAGPEPQRKQSIRIERLLIRPPRAPMPPKSKGKSARPLLAPPPPATSQTLVVPIKTSDPGHAVDASIEMNQRYRYVVERVVSLVLNGQSVEVAGQPSDPITVATTDIFPPPVPSGLAAVADPAGGAVDLSWTPDTAPDLAGYFLYRREVGSDVPGQAISPLDRPLTAPAFRDLNVKPGHRYAYSVSAIDESGNESDHSPEVVVRIPSH